VLTTPHRVYFSVHLSSCETSETTEQICIKFDIEEIMTVVDALYSLKDFEINCKETFLELIRMPSSGM
jgi:hypothetical protein